MARAPQGCDDLSHEPLPYVRGFYQLIPEGRRAAILNTDRPVVGTAGADLQKLPPKS